MLLGVDGVVVIGHGAAGARAVASCITLAAQAVREHLVPRIGEALASLVALRRGAVGVGR
jgi:fatty acid/phospholipid biosynthesis enzyme